MSKTTTTETETIIADATKLAAEEARRDGVELVNSSGHTQELERNFGIFSIISYAIVAGVSWTALAGGIVTALPNGGPPGLIYELIVVTFFYAFLFASLAELGSAIPSSAGVYHFAAVAAGQNMPFVGFLAGWWNFLAWIFGASSGAAILGNMVTTMWALYHPTYTFQTWHGLIVYLIFTWATVCIVLFGNRVLPHLNLFIAIIQTLGLIVTVIVCAVMPSQTGAGYASNEAVWQDWSNQSGWSSDGLVFLIGMLNGAFAMGTPDTVVHLSEEIPNPRKNIPKAMAAQITIGFVTAFVYLIAMFYALNDVEALVNTTYRFPVAEIYHQATGSRGGAIGLMLLVFVPYIGSTTACFILTGRMLWTLARDNATPFASPISRIHPRHLNPFNATIGCGCIVTVLGGVYVGSPTAFNAIIGCYVILTDWSYLSAILPHILSGRKNVKPGKFWMPGWIGVAVHTMSCIYVVTFSVIFCFPYVQPVAAETMNYTCVVIGGLTIFILIWWFWKKNHRYEIPPVLTVARQEIETVD